MEEFQQGIVNIRPIVEDIQCLEKQWQIRGIEPVEQWRIGLFREERAAQATKITNDADHQRLNFIQRGQCRTEKQRWIKDLIHSSCLLELTHGGQLSDIQRSKIGKFFEYLYQSIALIWERRHKSFDSIVVIFIVAEFMHQHSTDRGVESRSETWPTTGTDRTVIRAFRCRRMMKKWKELLTVVIDKILDRI